MPRALVTASSMADQILALLRRESGITETDCVAAIETAMRQDGEEGETAERISDSLQSDGLNRDEQEELRADPQVDREQRTVAFLDDGEPPMGAAPDTK